MQLLVLSRSFLVQSSSLSFSFCLFLLTCSLLLQESSNLLSDCLLFCPPTFSCLTHVTANGQCWQLCKSLTKSVMSNKLKHKNNLSSPPRRYLNLVENIVPFSIVLRTTCSPERCPENYTSKLFSRN